jgi:serine/threonine-protein kinase
MLTTAAAAPAPPLEGAPPDMAAVVARCLEKDPADRFPTAADLGRELAGCRCAADWSAERTAAWWAGLLPGGSPSPPDAPTQTST